MLPAIHVIGGVAGVLVLVRIAVQPEPAELIALRWGPIFACAGAALLASGLWGERRRV